MRVIEDADDVRDVIELLRLNYDRILADPTGTLEPETDGPGRPRDLDYRPSTE